VLCDTRPVCPVCGGLECLCRPRFFAGQLLTEDDLNRLEQYVVDKGKLRNRYLFGSGVACGLEVVCAVCDADANRKVVVKPGYALSPCGNDIVVCRQETVDMCELISRCRPPQADECLDPNAAAVLECVDAAEDWVLAVCSDEQPSRGVTALRGSGATPTCKCGGNCGCGGGGAGKGGCGCQGTGTAYTAKPAKTPAFVAAQCEPTLICETYRFTAYKAPKKTSNTVQWGELVTRFWCCIAPLLQAYGELPKQGATEDELLNWYLASKQTLRDFIISQGLYDCEVVQKFAAIQDPVKGRQDAGAFLALWQESLWALLVVASEVLQKCLCAALLPPCPPPALADCVPLATVTVRRNPCRVTHICNLSARSFLITMPNLEYWLSWIPLFGQNNQGPSLRQLFEAMCCTPMGDVVGNLRRENPNLNSGAATTFGGVDMSSKASPRPAAAPVPGSAFNQMMWSNSFDPQRKMTAPRFLLGAMGATDANNQPLASDAELGQPAAALLLSQVAGPALSTLLPPAVVAGGTFGAGAATARGDDVAALARTVSELQATVRKQQRDIERLKKK
jgi:hypothetical protein